VDALAGAAVVVNAVSDTKRMDRLVEGPGRLLAAEVDAGGGTTWNRCRRSRARAAAVLPGQPRQEQAVRESSAPFTVLRSTQFHDFLAWAFAAAARKHVLPSGQVPVQPAAVEEVARVVTDVSEREPSGATVTVAGPRVEVLADLVSAWRKAAHVRALAVPVPGINRTTRALRAGGLVPAGSPDVTTTTTFAAWLARS
jgi:hypothetical protein